MEFTGDGEKDTVVHSEVCGTYHEGFNSIRRTEIPCPTCPYSYKSTEQFKHHVCYELLTSSTGPYNTASQEVSSSQPVSPGTINNETKDMFPPEILTENKENVTKDGLQPKITRYTQSPWKLEYVLIAAFGLAFMGSILFIIVDKTRKKGCSRSKTDVEANISQDDDLGAPLLSTEVETHQTGQRSMATSSPDCIEMSDRDQTRLPNTPDRMDKSVSSQTSFIEEQPISPISSEQPTAKTNESETSNSRTDIQANINPACSGFSEEVHIETQQTGQRSTTTSSPDSTEMSDKNQTPNTPDYMDNSVLSQRSFNEQQPSSLMSSEQPTVEVKESDVSNLSTEMSIDNHSEDQGQSDIAGFAPERQELSDKEQTLPLNASDCVDNPSCKDQPYSATFRGQPTDETIGSNQSKCLPAAGQCVLSKSILQTVSSKDSISTQETSATEDYDKNQQSEASMIRKPPDKRFIPVEDNTSQNPVNTGSKKPKIAINVFGNSTDNANFSIYIDHDRPHIDIPLSTTISRENINQRPSPKEDPKAMKKNCVAELEVGGSGTTPIFSNDADQEPSFFYNQQGRENIDINFLLHENRELKEEILKLKDLRERKKSIEKREENMAERERVMAEREKMMRDREIKLEQSSWQSHE